MDKRRVGATKRCCYGLCNSDTRSKKFQSSNIFFIPSPKPCLEFRRRNVIDSIKNHVKECSKCAKSDKWVRLCGRKDIGFRSISNVTKDTYICSLHFEGENGPAEEHPDPVSLINKNSILKSKSQMRTSLEQTYKLSITVASIQKELSGVDKNLADTEMGGNDANDHSSVHDEAEAMDANSEEYNGIGAGNSNEKVDNIDNSQTEEVSPDVDINLSTKNVDIDRPHQSLESPEDIDLSVQNRLKEQQMKETSTADTSCIIDAEKEDFTGVSTENIQNVSEVRNDCNNCRNCALNPVKLSFKDYEIQTLHVEKRNCKTQTKKHSPMHEFEDSLRLDPKKCLFYTGLEFQQIEMILSLLSPACHHLQYWNTPTSSNNSKGMMDIEDRDHRFKLTIEQQLILVLVRLRTGLLVQDLAYRFNLSVGLITKIFVTWIQLIYVEFDRIFRADANEICTNSVVKRNRMFPTRQIVARTLPKSFKDLSNIRVLIDCTEYFFQSPSNFEQQGNMYLSHKAHFTFKVLIGCTPNGAICFVSDAYEGCISDREIFIRSKLADFLEKGDLVLADRGFTVADLIEAKGAHSNIPPFLKGRARLTPQEEIETKLIAKRRIYVEHAVGRLRQFRILQKTLPLTLSGTISQIVFICACLVNFQKPIVFD